MPLALLRKIIGDHPVKPFLGGDGLKLFRQRDVFFGRDLVKDTSQLTNRIKDQIANRADKRVFLRADARARYKAVVDVVDNVRAAGVDDLGLITEQKKNHPPGTPGAPTSGGTE